MLYEELWSRRSISSAACSLWPLNVNDHTRKKHILFVRRPTWEYHGARTKKKNIVYDFVFLFFPALRFRVKNRNIWNKNHFANERKKGTKQTIIICCDQVSELLKSKKHVIFSSTSSFAISFLFFCIETVRLPRSLHPIFRRNLLEFFLEQIQKGLNITIRTRYKCVRLTLWVCELNERKKNVTQANEKGNDSRA